MRLIEKVMKYLLKKSNLAIIPSTVSVEYKFTNPYSKFTQTYNTDACWDLYSTEDIIIQPKSTIMIPSGVIIQVPDGYEGEIKARSSFGIRGLMVHHGAIDAGFQGELNPIIINLTDTEVEIKKGDRVCSFCLRRKIDINWVQVDDFSKSLRGTNYLGSSGR